MIVHRYMSFKIDVYPMPIRVPFIKINCTHTLISKPFYTMLPPLNLTLSLWPSLRLYLASSANRAILYCCVGQFMFSFANIIQAIRFLKIQTVFHRAIATNSLFCSAANSSEACFQLQIINKPSGDNFGYFLNSLAITLSSIGVVFRDTRIFNNFVSLSQIVFCWNPILLY